MEIQLRTTGIMVHSNYSKPNKNNNSDTFLYIPISLLSALAKTLENDIHHKQHSTHHYTTRL